MARQLSATNLNRRLKMRSALLVALMPLLAGTGGLAAQEVDEFIYLPSARLLEAVRTASAAAPAAVLATTLEQRNDHASIMVRRTESSAPELHEAFDDVYIVHDGAAVLVYGGTYQSAQTIEPGELRGGTITGGGRQALAPGDVVVVPAAVPHQVVIEPGGSIIYHVVKVRRGE
jgi:mannose-6-phosphate isomerase-like protein (cupin superfamily)